MSKILYLEFANDGGNVFRMSLDDPKADLNEGLVREKMDLIVGANVFASKGDVVTKSKKAYIVERQVTEIF